MVIRVRNGDVMIMTDDEREFNMDYLQMEQIRVAIEIIENIDATVEALTIRVETKPGGIISNKEE